MITLSDSVAFPAFVESAAASAIILSVRSGAKSNTKQLCFTCPFFLHGDWTRKIVCR